jgi:hypothetical protein
MGWKPDRAETFTTARLRRYVIILELRIAGLDSSSIDDCPEAPPNVLEGELC